MTSFFIPRGLRVREADSNPSVIASELVFPNTTLSVAGSVVTVQSSGVTDGDKGDITVSASGATWTIDNSVVTTAKLGGDITTAGKALLDDADASAQRTTLGLGTLATQSGTFSGTSSGTNTGDQTNITGNAATVTTNANLTGHVTSVGNAAVLGSFTKAQLDAAVSDGNVLYVGDVTSNATHTGDVTGDTALTIANSAVTLAKMANLAQDQFIGRTTASTGVPETATITAAARTVLDDTTVAAMLTTLGGIGAVGTTLADILSVSGSDLVADDLAADKLYGWDDSESKAIGFIIGSGLSVSGDTLSATASGGSKTYAVFTAEHNQPTATAFATLDTRNSIAVLDFDDATDESAVFVSVIPEAASLGSGLKIRLHWMATSATSGNVVWDVSLERMTTDLDSDSFDTIASGTAAANGTSGILTVTEITLTTIDSVTAGDGYRLKVTRDANNASDTMTGDAELVVCEVRSAA